MMHSNASFRKGIVQHTCNTWTTLVTRGTHASHTPPGAKSGYREPPGFRGKEEFLSFLPPTHETP